MLTAGVNCQHATWLEVVKIQPDSFYRQQMHRNGITAKRIHDKDVRIVRSTIIHFFFQRQACIAANQRNFCR